MAQVRAQAARSANTDPNAAAEEVLATLGAFSPKVLFGFIPGTADHRAFHAALRARLPKDARLITSSTGGEITNEGMFSGNLVVTGLAGDIDVGIGWGTGLGKDAARAGASAMDAAARELGVRVQNLDRKYGAIVIDDGFKMKKEEMLLGVLEKNQGLIVVGGGAGDYEFMRGTAWMGVDGEVFTDAALVMLFRTNAPWQALRTHAYEPTGHRVRLTKVDLVARRILEIDNKPAGPRWAEIVGVPPEYLTFAHPDQFLKFPLAMRVGREYFLRAISKNMQDDSLDSMNMVQEDLELEVMRLGNLVESTRKFLVEEVPRRVPNPTAALFFDCGARKLLASMTGKLDELGAVYRQAPPCGGFTVHFETYCGFMVNSTLTSLVFGSQQ